MLTFSGEQPCIEVAVCICVSSLALSFSSVQTDRDETLAPNQNTPTHHCRLLSPSPCALLPLSFLSRYLSLFILSVFCICICSPAVEPPPSRALFTSHFPQAPVSLFHFRILPSSVTFSLTSPRPPHLSSRNSVRTETRRLLLAV